MNGRHNYDERVSCLNIKTNVSEKFASYVFRILIVIGGADPHMSFLLSIDQFAARALGRRVKRRAYDVKFAANRRPDLTIVSRSISFARSEWQYLSIFREREDSPESHVYEDSQRQGLFESSDVASNRTSRSGHELSNPSSSASFNFIYTRGGHVTCESPSGSRETSCGVIKPRIGRGTAKYERSQDRPIRDLSCFKAAPSSFLNKARLDVLEASKDLVVVRFTLFAPQSSAHTPLLTGSASSAAHPSAISLALFSLPTFHSFSLSLAAPRVFA